MKRVFLVVLLCLAFVSVSHAQALKNLGDKVTDKATTAAKDKANEAADDTAITADVKLKISNTASLKDSKIEVSTTGGVVTLTGEVKNAQTKGVATKVVKSVKGVKSVENKLTIAKAAKKGKKSK